MNPTQSQPTALPKHTPTLNPNSEAPEWSVVGVPCEGADAHPDRVCVYHNGILVVDARDEEPTHAALCELTSKANSRPALVAENKRLREALEDCNGVLDSINRQLGGKSVGVRAVLDKARAALAKEDV